MSVYDTLSAAAAGVFPGARVSVADGIAMVRVVDGDTVTDVGTSAINAAKFPRDPNALTEAVANCVMQIARSRFYNTRVI